MTVLIFEHCPKSGNWKSFIHILLSSSLSHHYPSPFAVSMRIYSCLSHPCSTKLQFKSISCLPWQKKRDGSQIQCSGMLYIIFDWKAVCSMQNHGLLMFHSFITLAPGILKVHVIHTLSISISSYDFAICILPFFYSFTSHQKFRSPYVSERKKNIFSQQWALQTTR